MGTAIVANAGATLPYGCPGLRDRLHRRLGALLADARRAARRPGRRTGSTTATRPAPTSSTRRSPRSTAVCRWRCSRSAAAPCSSAGTGSARSAAVALDAVLYTAGYRHRPRGGRRDPVPDGGPAPHRSRPGVPRLAAARWWRPWSRPPSARSSMPHLPAGQAQETMLFACFAMFGLSLLATLVMLPLIFARLLTAARCPLALTPTLFLVLGPLGQSTTAANKFADAAAGRRPRPATTRASRLRRALRRPVMGFALLWLALAAAMVVRRPAPRHGLRDDLVGVHLPRRAPVSPAPRAWATTPASRSSTGCAIAALRPAGGRRGGGRSTQTLRGTLNGRLLAAPR